MLLALLLATAVVQGGNIVVHDGGTARAITTGGGYSDPTISPDGQQVAFIHHDDDTGDQGHSSLWLAPVKGGAARKLFAGREAQSPERNLARIENPHWSLDGNYLYVEAAAWATSSAIHQIDVRSGRERYVIDGWSFGVVRGGRWRGYLLVGQHKYRGPPNYGSYNPVSLVRPDGRVQFRIPGSATDDGEHSVPRWLRAQRTTAS